MIFMIFFGFYRDFQFVLFLGCFIFSPGFFVLCLYVLCLYVHFLSG